MSKLLTTDYILTKYGQPGDIKNLVSITLPYPFRLDWNVAQSISTIVCHKLIADRLKSAFKEILDAYGQTKIRDLGIDEFGGCFNHRPQRGYETQYAAAVDRGDWNEAIKYLSRHSWAIAIDLDPNRNLLKETAKTARFARPEYKQMIDIFYKHDFLSYGIERGNDFMHFETAI